jgi:hypothetical protein
MLSFVRYGFSTEVDAIEERRETRGMCRGGLGYTRGSFGSWRRRYSKGSECLLRISSAIDISDIKIEITYLEADSACFRS